MRAQPIEVRPIVGIEKLYGDVRESDGHAAKKINATWNKTFVNRLWFIWLLVAAAILGCRRAGLPARRTRMEEPE
jgi:hypothetical protein